VVFQAIPCRVGAADFLLPLPEDFQGIAAWLQAVLRWVVLRWLFRDCNGDTAAMAARMPVDARRIGGIMSIAGRMYRLMDRRSSTGSPDMVFPDPTFLTIRMGTTTTLLRPRWTMVTRRLTCCHRIRSSRLRLPAFIHLLLVFTRSPLAVRN